MMWLDVLDMPTVNHFEASFAEHFDDAMQNTSRQDGDSLDRYGSGVLPDGVPVEMQKRTPVINYTYARMRPILERLKNAGDIDKRHGARVRYANPITGGPVLPTMGAYLALLPQASRARPTARPTAPCSSAPKGRGAPRSATRCWIGARTTCSWCRRGCPIPTWPIGVGAVLDLRPAGPGSARHLARGGLRFLLSRAQRSTSVLRCRPGTPVCGRRVDTGVPHLRCTAKQVEDARKRANGAAPRAGQEVVSDGLVLHP